MPEEVAPEVIREEVYREAEARIAAWQPGGTLDLRIGGLERIPNEVAGLTGLQSLACSVTPVADLSPLAGLTALQSLDCSATRVADLSPLAGLTALQSLDCRATQVADLSPLAGLTGLVSLDCRATGVADLSPLAGLTGLQSLACSGPQLADLSPLAGLTGLQSLNCSGTQVADLSPLAGLTGLQSLDCRGTQVADLSPLAGLTALQRLDCSWTEVADLSPLAGLTGLQSLACRETKVADLSPLAGLTALQSVDCSETEAADLSPLAGLTGLQRLDCDGCHIATFPKGFFDRPALDVFMLYEGALGDVPAEVLSQRPNENCLPRLRAHLRDLGAVAEPLRDAKLLVLGNGRVGKTQLCRRLLGEPYDESVASTHGITIRHWELTETPDGVPARVHLWDFGGQDIYHSTHVLFLRGRAMFLVAWTPAMEDLGSHVHAGLEFRNRPLPYWISQVAEFAGADTPLILVQTQADRLADRAPLPEAAQQMVSGFATHVALHHSAATGRGQDDLEEAIAEGYATIPQPTIGRVRAAVKRTIEDLIAAGTQRTMALDAFRGLCDAKGGVADAELFLEALHNAGTVFYWRGYSRDELILDQAWAIAAIYALFERESATYPALLSMGGQR